jgi:hypothetical protein
MAVLVAVNPEPATISDPAHPDERTRELGSAGLLDVVQRCLHPKPSEWIFLRELRVGTGFRSSSAQRLDAFALNCFVHNSMKRACYEVKTSRADFLCEMKQPLKRRVGLRYSNEFYFVTPAGLLNTSEIPIECGLVEIGIFTDEQPESILAQSAAFAHFDPRHGSYCRVTVPAPRRETPGPTWQFVAGMLHNQQRAYQEKPPKPPNQQRLPFVG